MRMPINWKRENKSAKKLILVYLLVFIIITIIIILSLLLSLSLFFCQPDWQQQPTLRLGVLLDAIYPLHDISQLAQPNSQYAPSSQQDQKHFSILKCATQHPI